MEQSPGKQLQQLEEEYRRRRAEIKGETEQTENLPAERETMSKVVEETIQGHIPTFQASVNQSAAAPLTDEQRSKVQEWVTLVFSKGVDEGIKAARTANDPALLDAFHDILTGELHDQLVQRGKLEAI